MVADYYLPGYKSGGPVRSLENMVSHLSREFSFFILTRDRDLGDREPYPDLERERWMESSGSHIYYLPPRAASWRGLYRVVRSRDFDLVYLNSFFSVLTIKLLLMRRLGLWPAGLPLILAPRGEFSQGALVIKKHKKRAYIFLARLLNLYGKITFQASSDFEKEDIARFFPQGIIAVAPDLLPPPAREAAVIDGKPAKRKGELRLVFLSRVSPKKNLRGALEMVSRLKGRVYFDIYGPVDDEQYYRECLPLINRMPANITCRYCGSVPAREVPATFSAYHFMFLPTLGENYGHVIPEAMARGCPVIISDQTPWRDLEAQGAGWDISLQNRDRFIRVLQECVAMEDEEYSKMSEQAVALWRQTVNHGEAVEQNRQLFSKAK